MNRCALKATIALFLWGVANPVSAIADDAACVPDPVAAKVEEVAPGIHVRRGEVAIAAPGNGNAIANIGFIVGEDAVAVIDTGGSICDGLSLRAAIRRVTDKPIRYVINTHVHPDHVLGNAAFLDDKPAFVGHRRLPAALAARGDYYLDVNRRLVGGGRFGPTTIVPPTETVDDKRAIDLGGRKLLLTAHTAGHTDNDLSVVDTKTGTLFAGDLVFMEHIPVVDGSLTGWLRVIPELEALPGINSVVPGHGPSSAPWPQALDHQKAYLTQLANDVRRLLAQGAEIGDAKTAAKDEAARWELDESFHERNANTAFSELEWEE